MVRRKGRKSINQHTPQIFICFTQHSILFELHSQCISSPSVYCAREGSSSITVKMADEDDAPCGLSFQNISCHGILSSARYQATIASYLLAVPRFASRLLSTRTQRKIQILHDFNGLVLPGEMLLVLGRPGSGCSTLLKTLAGDTHGFHVDDEKSINYQGKSSKRGGLFRACTGSYALARRGLLIH